MAKFPVSRILGWGGHNGQCSQGVHYCIGIAHNLGMLFFETCQCTAQQLGTKRLQLPLAQASNRLDGNFLPPSMPASKPSHPISGLPRWCGDNLEQGCPCPEYCLTAPHLRGWATGTATDEGKIVKDLWAEIWWWLPTDIFGSISRTKIDMFSPHPHNGSRQFVHQRHWHHHPQWSRV